MIVFSIQLMRFGPDIRRLNKIETIAQLASFARDQQDMTVAFGKATNASDRMQSAADNALKDLESLKEYVADLQEKMSEYNAPQSMQARLDLEDTQPKRGVLWQRNAAAPAQARSPDDLYSNMRLEW